MRGERRSPRAREGKKQAALSGRPMGTDPNFSGQALDPAGLSRRSVPYFGGHSLPGVASVRQAISIEFLIRSGLPACSAKAASE